ncbi:hypothetical protein OY671_010196, partial [Metschnikowia pulcherrima]
SELLSHRTKGVHFGDGVERHEADIVAVQRILRPRIAQPDPDLHGGDAPSLCARLQCRAHQARRHVKTTARQKRTPPARGGRGLLSGSAVGLLLEGRRKRLPEDQASVLVVSPSSLLSEEGATIVAMVKSRSVIAVFTPAGSVTESMWIESPTSKPVTSTTMSSG